MNLLKTIAEYIAMLLLGSLMGAIPFYLMFLAGVLK
jgi:hypothetical protein